MNPRTGDSEKSIKRGKIGTSTTKMGAGAKNGLTDGKLAGKNGTNGEKAELKDTNIRNELKTSKTQKWQNP
ncbi:hypothetical protein [Methanosarcina sp. KYL-1]|uniref:hypothetical protein n=1 Tax=Methanosarcina sp. KYL-1 TaxID=2602068 RepID=UPI00210068B4|nr:hypothetical protein [Methanosarcina sp. KYL-1]